MLIRNIRSMREQVEKKRNDAVRRGSWRNPATVLLIVSARSSVPFIWPTAST